VASAHHIFARRFGATALGALVLAGVAGCSDNPFAYKWSDEPRTVLLYSMARPELNLVSGFNFRQSVPVRVEAATATGYWDAAVDTRGGQIVLLPPGAFGISSTARIATLPGRTLEDVKEAPQDTAVYIAADPVAVEEGTVYIVKTNRQAGSFGTRCVYYAKMEPLVIDAAGGTLTFRYVTSPICNSLDLVPPG